MTIYMILDAEVHDTAAYESYKEAAPHYVARHGGEYCCRGGDIEVVGGEWHPQRIVMLKFPSRAAFDALMADPDYQPWKELRESLTTIKAQVILEGV
jgi:uncharacterized protein (DUF1330 family)